MGDERKSGLLFPSFGHSGSNGYELEVPYYFNLAPNYDVTLTPGSLSARGVQLGGEFRFLTAGSHGQIDANFLPDDTQSSTATALLLTSPTSPTSSTGLRFDTDIASVSDSNYFEDFAVGSDQTSVTFLERRAELLYYDDAWRIRGAAAELPDHRHRCHAAQSDAGGYCDQRPYSRVPRIQANALWPVLGHAFRVRAGQRGRQFPARSRSHGRALECGAGAALVEPRTPGYFFEPAVGYRFHPVRSKECRPSARSEHADPDAALRAAGHRTGVRARRRLAGPAHPDPRAAPGLQLRALPQSERAADIRHRDCPT